MRLDMKLRAIHRSTVGPVTSQVAEDCAYVDHHLQRHVLPRQFEEVVQRDLANVLAERGSEGTRERSE